MSDPIPAPEAPAVAKPSLGQNVEAGLRRVEAGARQTASRGTALAYQHPFASTAVSGLVGFEVFAQVPVVGHAGGGLLDLAAGLGVAYAAHKYLTRSRAAAAPAAEAKEVS